VIGVDSWLAAGAFFLTLGFLATLAARGVTDVISLTVLSFSLFYGFRTALLVAGLDTPSPSYLFPLRSLDADLTRTLLATTLFLAGMVTAVWAIVRARWHGYAPFFASSTPPPDRQFRAALFFTGCSTLISLVLLAKFGGPSHLIAAAKFDKALAGFYVFRVFPAVGSLLCAGAFLDLRNRPGWGFRATVCLLCSMVNSVSVFLWGSRGLIVISIAVIAIGLGRGATSQGGSRIVRTLLVVMMTAVLVFAVAGALRSARDTLTHGKVQAGYADASFWRRASLATNSVALDAAILAFRDVPSAYPSRNGVDFLNGVVGVVPRSIWVGKPRNIAPGSWFREQYQPKVVNGWPMGAPALWYLDFGWLGVPIGGLLSGFAIGAISARQRRVANSGHNIAVAAAAAVFVFGLGWDNQTLVYIILWLVPFWFVARYFSAGHRVSRPPDQRRTAFVSAGL
jgi:oligosaccharide repeat unit polymerase